MSKTQPSHAVPPQSDAEAIVVQHVLAFYRDMKRNAQNAPIGQFLNYAAAVTVEQGRKLVQTSLQTLTQEEVNEVEKKTRRDSVDRAEKRNATWAEKQKTSKPPSEP